ncbi:MAG: radical SAM protein [Acidobacteriota bacterium]
MKPRKPLKCKVLLSALGRLLGGYRPILSIEITRSCPLSCPGCYAFGANHLGGRSTLKELRDLRGEHLVDRVLSLIREHLPLHVAFVGGEPLIRRRELSGILPQLSQQGIYSLVVTSAVIPWPREWSRLPRVCVTVSVDGLQPDHDQRRAPATYDCILKNIQGRKVDISWVITNRQLLRPGYLDDYLAFWTARPEVRRIWLSLYTPQKGESSEEKITPGSRKRLLRELPALKQRYPQLVLPQGGARAFAQPPQDPEHCTFTRLSLNYSVDLRSRVEPCFFGGNPDCTQCGCAVSAGLHWLHERPLVGGLKAGHIIDWSLGLAGREKGSGRRPHPNGRLGAPARQS